MFCMLLMNGLLNEKEWPNEGQEPFRGNLIGLQLPYHPPNELAATSADNKTHTTTTLLAA